MAELPDAPVKRILVEASGGMRIGGSALDRAVAEAESYLRRLGQAAGQSAATDQRKTIQDGDIAQAAASLGGSQGAPTGATA